MAERVEIDIIARVENATKDLISFITKLTGLSLSIGTAVKLTKELWNQIEVCARAYVESEKSITRMGTALRITDQYSEAAMKSLNALAAQMLKTTIYTDEASREAAGLLIQLGELDVKGVRRLLPLVADFAASMGMDLVSAATLVGKTLGGEVNSLSRYGVSVKETTDKSERLAEVTSGLSEKFKGMAASIALTTGGQLEQLKNQLDEVREMMGKVSVQAVLLKDKIRLAFTMGIGGILELIKLSNSESSIIRPSVGTMPEKSREQLLSGNVTLEALDSYFQSFLERIGAVPSAAIDREAISQSNIARIVAAAEEAWALRGIEPSKHIAQSPRGAMPWDTMENYDSSMFAGIPAPNVPHQQQPDYTTGELNQGMPSRMQDQVDAWERMSRLIPTANADLKMTEATYQSLFTIAADATRTMTEAFISGDIVGGLAAIGTQLSSMVTQYAIGAAAAAAMAGKWDVMTGWLAIAGISAISGGVIGAMGQSTDIPSYDTGGVVGQTGLAVVHKGERVLTPGQGGGGTTIIHVHGNIWQTEDLARAIARSQARW